MEDSTREILEHFGNILVDLNQSWQFEYKTQLIYVYINKVYFILFKNIPRIYPTTLVEYSICYAFMQVIDIVDDHTSQCLFYQKCF